MGFSLRGAMAGAGAAMEQSGLAMVQSTLDEQRQARLEDLRARNQASAQERGFAHEEQMVGVRETSRRAGRQADIEQDVSPENIAKRGAAAVALSQATLPSRVAERSAFAEVDTQAKVEEFSRLAPLQRQEAIDSAVAVLQAQSTPEMLRATRQIAQAKHIVDPSYTLIPNADGTVTTFDTRSGRSGGTLLDANRQPIIRKDPEELKAATAVINMANTNLRIAQTEHKAVMDDVMNKAPERAAANTRWQEAQNEQQRLTAPAYAILFAKSGIAPTENAPQFPEPTANDIALLRRADKNLSARAAFDTKFGAGAAARHAPQAVPPQGRITGAQTGAPQGAQGIDIPPEYFDAQGNYVGRPRSQEGILPAIVPAISGTAEALTENWSEGQLRMRLRTGRATPADIEEARRLRLIR